MSTADSQLDLGNAGNRSETPLGAASGQGKAGIWLNGDVLACACPDCNSPMSIRLWLMVADCWRCGTTLELTEEQEREARRLLAERDQARQSSAAPPPRAEPQPQPRPEPRPAVEAAPTPPPQALPKPASRPAVASTAPAALPQGGSAGRVFRDAPAERQPAAFKPGRIRSHMEDVKQVGEVRLWFRDKFRDLPAWLASAVIHLALLILLAFTFFVMEPEGERPLTLSARISELDREGGWDDPQQLDPIEFDDAGGVEVEEELVIEQPAELIFEEPPAGDLLGNLEDVLPPAPAATSGGGKSLLIGRNPRARARLVEEEGGTIQSEAAVKRGLEWLARHQDADGKWSLNGFHNHPGCRGRCGDPGQPSDMAATAMALLPFLGAGQTHEQGDYKETVRQGLYWLLKHQGSDGDLRGRGVGRMYAHGQAAIVLCEAFAMTRDEALRGPAQLALDFIVKAQHPKGGWRYSPGQAGDTSVVGWQLMALRSGQMAYLNVPPETLELANLYLEDARANSKGSRYGYMPGSGGTHVMTAEALLCRQYAGWEADHPAIVEGCEWMLRSHPPDRKQASIYYWYYATQVMHHVGGSTWKRWNNRMRDLLVDMQERSGHQAGSWTPPGNDHLNRAGGRIYWTSLAICTLEVYYRHLPLYRRSAVE